MVKLLLLIPLMALGACREQSPPAPTAEETERLDEMEASLNDLAQNEKGPADRSAGPSNESD